MFFCLTYHNHKSVSESESESDTLPNYPYKQFQIPTLNWGGNFITFNWWLINFGGKMGWMVSSCCQCRLALVPWAWHILLHISFSKKNLSLKNDNTLDLWSTSDRTILRWSFCNILERFWFVVLFNKGERLDKLAFLYFFYKRHKQEKYQLFCFVLCFSSLPLDGTRCSSSSCDW